MPLAILLLAIAFAVSPFLQPEFGGFDPNQFPVPQDDPPVQPAGYAFSIWGVIYLWLIASAGFGLLRRADAAEWQAMRPPLAVSLAVGAVWLAVAMRSPIWASVLIWIMLLGALAAVLRAPRDDRALAVWPVGLYAGWLTAASCVSLGLLVAGYGWTSEATAAYAALVLALVIGLAVQFRVTNAPTYGIALIWALVAVAVQNGFALASPGGLALAGAVLVAVVTMRATLQGR